MRQILSAAAAALALGGCASLAGADPTSQLPQQLLDNLKHCKRTYQASVGGFGLPGGSLYIECPAQPHEDLGPVT